MDKPVPQPECVNLRLNDQNGDGAPRLISDHASHPLILNLLIQSGWVQQEGKFIPPEGKNLHLSAEEVAQQIEAMGWVDRQACN